ncbi:MAG: hypothetical protein L6R40_008332 [Gallowayella cf. fulva]|nr:MAG: hypothetical protein L6R40_008332 [Xanthomendoza cf. fulva]
MLTTAQDWQPRQSRGLAFKQAVNDSRYLKVRPSDDEMLELYSLYKQGIQDPPFALAPRPGAFDLLAERMKGKAKIKAWQDLVHEGLTPEQAQETYAVLVDSLKVKYGFDQQAASRESTSK